MSQKFLIDLSPQFKQRFSVALAGQKLKISLLWSEEVNGWLYSVGDNNGFFCQGRVARLGVDMFFSISKFVTGSLILEGEIPTRDNLGSDCQLFFYSESQS